MAFDTVWTRYAEARQLAAVLKGVAITPAPADWKVGLMLGKAGYDATKIPGRDDVAEVTGQASYTRQALGATTLTEVANTAPKIANDAAFQYPEAQEAWGEIVALGLYDAAGNLWAVMPSAIADRRTVRIGDRMTVPAGQLVITGYTP